MRSLQGECRIAEKSAGTGTVPVQNNNVRRGYVAEVLSSHSFAPSDQTVRADLLPRKE